MPPGVAGDSLVDTSKASEFTEAIIVGVVRGHLWLPSKAEGNGHGKVEEDGKEGHVGFVTVASNGVLTAEFLELRKVGLENVGIGETCAALYYIYVARVSEAGVFRL